MGGRPLARRLARAADRDGNRAAQLLRGPRDRAVRGPDQVTLALVLIIGFGLHNATEGFGIVAPLSGSETRPTWKFLFLLGLIGGGPTFVGTLLGHVWVNETVSVAFLALAAGSILYVVIQLMNVNQKLGYKTLVAWMLLAGLSLGFATDFIIEAAGV